MFLFFLSLSLSVRFAYTHRFENGGGEDETDLSSGDNNKANYVLIVGAEKA